MRYREWKLMVISLGTAFRDKVIFVFKSNFNRFGSGSYKVMGERTGLIEWEN